MAKFEDALARQRALARNTQSEQNAQAEQLEWARAESIGLARRFIEGLSRAGYGPLALEGLEFTRSERNVRVGGVFSRRFRAEHEWSSNTRSAGQGWPILVEGWEYRTDDLMNSDGQTSRYGQSVAAGLVFRPDLGQFSSVVFEGISRQREDQERHAYGSGFNPPQFGSLLKQPMATLRLVPLRGDPCGGGCWTCKDALPLWIIRMDGARLPIGPGSVMEQDAQGRWQRVYPDTLVITDEAKRYDTMLGRAIQALDENLRAAGASWP